MKAAMILLIRFYQTGISPFLPATCRYTPTCSAYFLEAVQKYGALKGTKLGILRILRCHPLHAGGYDPVPAEEDGAVCWHHTRNERRK